MALHTPRSTLHWIKITYRYFLNLVHEPLLSTSLPCPMSSQRRPDFFFTFKFPSERRMRRVVMTCPGPWTWRAVRERLVVCCVGYNKHTRTIDYRLDVVAPSQVTPNSWVSPYEVYTIKRLPEYYDPRARPRVDPVRMKVFFRE